MLYKTWHSHIKGFSLEDTETFGAIKNGFIGRNFSKNEAKIMIELIKKKKNRKNYHVDRKYWSRENCLGSWNRKRNRFRNTFLFYK
mmetsp:Transcript_64198/g.157941  ORF Transcript_64198/g.157941 Transcript_64198/m.157941 type:complete len:86 (-) Transcript_64198:3889-4146(-)